MTDLTQLHIKVAISAHAQQSRPEEACGFVVDGQVWPCKNIHPSPTTNFAIDAAEYARAEEAGHIDAIYHSHVDGMEGFSVHDVQACKASNVPWIVYHAPSANFFIGDPTGAAPYLGRQWIYGIHDCYALMRDFYRREFGIVLDDFERGNDGEWENSDWTMFIDNYSQQGFVVIDKPARKGDVVVMRMGASSPNHVGVIADNGWEFYQHLTGRLSQKNVYGGYWAKVTAMVWRHRDLLS